MSQGRTPSQPASSCSAAAADARAGELRLADRFRRHADALTRDGRSALSAQLMYAAADDLDAGGVVAAVFEPVATPPGSVAQLRLLGALHQLVLEGRAPAPAPFYPSVGGEQPPGGAWPAARAAIAQHLSWIQQRVSRAVQTNEPGRSAVLYAGLLWLSHRYEMPIRLLEIGASAGLNLHVDRYGYALDAEILGEANSAVRFVEPWRPGPPIASGRQARKLRITTRAGCDVHPLDPAKPGDRLALLSYIWPDETERLARTVAALAIAARHSIPIARADAAAWLPQVLTGRRPDELTVIWQSVVRQYVDDDAWMAVAAAVRRAAQAKPEAPTAWLAMEPGEDHLAHMRVTLREPPDEREHQLAWCGDHGPPVEWTASS